MSQFKIFSNQGQVLESKIINKKQFCFMDYLEDFLDESCLDISNVDLDLTIKTINRELGMNIRTVLSVEDDETLRETLTEFGRRSGHLFISAPTAEEAEKLVMRYPNLFDIVLLDKRLPGVDGDVFGKKLKSFTPKIRAHIVTGDPDSIDETLLERGIESIVKKPINYQMFLNLVGDYYHSDFHEDEAA